MDGEFEHFEKAVEEANNIPAETTTEEVDVVEKTTEEVVVDKTTEEAEKVAEEVIEEEVKLDPLADLPEDVKQYAAAKKENPDLTFADFQKEQSFDITSLSILDVAREKAIRESDGKITTENVDAYLEKKTGIVLTDEDAELDEYDEIDLEKFIGDFRDSFGKKTEPTQEAKEDAPPTEELIELEKGFKIEKSVYETLQSQQKEYVSRMEKSVAEVNEITFEFEFDNNGTKEIVPLSYTTTDADKQLMLSTAKDVNNEVDKMFRNKDGNFQDREFNEGLLRLSPVTFKKMVNTLINKAVAISTEKLLKQEYNPNFQGTNFRQEANPSAPKQQATYRAPGTLQVDVV